MVFLFFKQKTAYEMRISDWSSDVCSSDLVPLPEERLLQSAGGRPAGSGTKRTGRGRTSKGAYGGGTAAGGRSADDPAVHADPLVDGRPECAGLGGQRRGPADRKSTRLNSSH